MRTNKSWMVVACLAAASIARAQGANGLAVSDDAAAWSHWQARMAINTATPLWRSDLARGDAAGLKVQGLTLLGDYYFARLPLGAAGSGGFRATSGLMLGNGAPLWAAPGVGLGRRNASLLPGVAGSEMAAVDSANIPYLGLGYSGISGRGGWNFAADVGVMALNAGSAVRFGRLFNGSQSVDDLVRELRLTPVLQLGVSYAF